MTSKTITEWEMETENMNGKPSVDQVVASMSEQIEATAIKVTFTRQSADRPVSPPLNYYRSANVTSLRSDQARVWSWFDRTRSIFRSQHPEQRGPGLVGEVGTRADPALSGAVLPDPIVYMFPDGYLYDVISSGTIAPDSEQVDGADCWRVDVTSRTFPNHSYSVWVDPAIRYLPRKITMDRTNASYVATLSDYKEIGGRIWYPSHMHWDGGFKVVDDTVVFLEDVRIMDVEFVHISVVDAQPEFSSGVRVHDVVQQ
jgi:hypothetical protein